jgi:hypothetical protein
MNAQTIPTVIPVISDQRRKATMIIQARMAELSAMTRPMPKRLQFYLLNRAADLRAKATA